MIFLGKKEEKLPGTYKFSKHYYGPFSRKLGESLSSLVADGVLKEQSVHYPFVGEYGQVVEYRYALTPFGLELLKIYSAELTDKDREKIRKLSGKFDKMNLDALISYVYAKYVEK